LAPGCFSFACRGKLDAHPPHSSPTREEHPARHPGAEAGRSTVPIQALIPAFQTHSYTVVDCVEVQQHRASAAFPITQRPEYSGNLGAADSDATACRAKEIQYRCKPRVSLP
jgi:hypothetical protein